MQKHYLDVSELNNLFLNEIVVSLNVSRIRRLSTYKGSVPSLHIWEQERRITAPLGAGASVAPTTSSKFMCFITRIIIN